ncbi:hypothetical protein [Brucella suis]|uniref:hypothetical protein n=1 Tax=Brucella suis TaxID=29461 RepID=UPI0001B48700|nr:hypothetical protein [Brucella suis]EEY30551.1 conserved hypothetical protein [Brucella suis bv. 5 str. 513]
MIWPYTPFISCCGPYCSVRMGPCERKNSARGCPRNTIHCETIAMDRNPQGSPRIRRCYLDHNSKVALYVDLGNFCLFHLAVESASLNGGFGRALNSIRMIA